MPVVQSFTCPHCNKSVQHQVNFIPIAMPRPKDWATHMIVCPHCNKALGVHSAPRG